MSDLRRPVNLDGDEQVETFEIELVALSEVAPTGSQVFEPGQGPNAENSITLELPADFRAESSGSAPPPAHEASPPLEATLASNPEIVAAPEPVLPAPAENLPFDAAPEAGTANLMIPEESSLSAIFQNSQSSPTTDAAQGLHSVGNMSDAGGASLPFSHELSGRVIRPEEAGSLSSIFSASPDAAFSDSNAPTLDQDSKIFIEAAPDAVAPLAPAEPTHNLDAPLEAGADTGAASGEGPASPSGDVGSGAPAPFDLTSFSDTPVAPAPPAASDEANLAHSPEAPVNGAETEAIRDYLPGASLDDVRDFSESASPSREFIPAAYAFSVTITGALSLNERARLVDLIGRENMGIREMDLEPQFEAQRILIPRISEYAAVLVAQSLRGTTADIKLGPSDEIFATADTRATRDEKLPEPEHRIRSDISAPTLATQLPVTQSSELPGSAAFQIIDVVTASASLKTSQLEPESSIEYQELVERLQTELKLKALRKGATAILNFNVQITGTSLHAHYKVMVMGSAVKATSGPLRAKLPSA